jgi:hypothetical protein
MNRRFAAVIGTLAIVGTAAGAAAQDAATEKQLLANERAISEAIAKGNAAAFKEHVAAEGWYIDAMAGRASVAGFLKEFDKLAKELKVASWDLTEPRTHWVDANTAVLTYKWVGKGTYQGQPMPSPVWCSTVWAKRGGKWMAIFHQETNPMPPPPPPKPKK